MPHGVTERMIRTYAPAIFELGLNIQRRKGDAVRKLDWAAIQAQRDGTGRTDAEIAERLGLAEEQVTFIRVVAERRVFRRDQYRKLFGLGAGKRYRALDGRAAPGLPELDAEAMLVRQAMHFDPEQVAHFAAEGLWTGATLDGWVRARAKADPQRVALKAGSVSIDWQTLDRRVSHRAARLAEAGLERGRVASVEATAAPETVVAWMAIARLGAVALLLPPGQAMIERRLCLAKARPQIDLTATPLADSDAEPPLVLPPSGLASDPVALLVAEGGGEPKLALHTHQTLAAAARALAGALTIGSGDTISASGSLAQPPALLALLLALATGARLDLSGGTNSTWHLAAAGEAGISGKARLVAVGPPTFASLPAGMTGLWSRPEALAIALGHPLVALPGMTLRQEGGVLSARGACGFAGWLGEMPAPPVGLADGGWIAHG